MARSPRFVRKLGKPIEPRPTSSLGLLRIFPAARKSRVTASQWPEVIAMNGDPKTRHDPADQRPQRQLMAATAAATGQGNPPFPPKVGGRPIAIGSIAPPKRASSRHSSETRSLRDRTVLFGVIGALAFAALYFVYWLITLLKLGSASLMLFTAINTIGFLSFLAYAPGPVLVGRLGTGRRSRHSALSRLYSWTR